MWENLNEKIIYAPELQDYFGDIMFINDRINKDNKKHDMGAFRLWKPQTKGARKVPEKNMYVPKLVNNR